ncbi:MAG TPA: hypothetical protein DCY35_03115 [Prolixibacteraceae bacterium]|nr:hypothetical protein [Prolixibacteraceae bacterium]
MVKRIFLFCAVILCQILNLTGQERNDWRDLSVIDRNKEKGRTTFKSFAVWKKQISMAFFSFL